MQIDAVKQRAAELALVAGHLIGRAAAAAGGVAQVAARTGVHGGNELKARRKLALHRRARDADLPGLEWFAQRLQSAARKFGEFVQKQHAVVGQ